MTKNIRVAWDDLKPGDKVHLHGSHNVYEFIRKPDIGNHADDTFVVSVPGISHIAVSRIVFDYATRHAPRKPKLHEPTSCGEYWLRVRCDWRKLFVMYTFGGGKYFHYAGYWYTTWGGVLKAAKPSILLTAEEYYTRKVKGEI
ncbi:hypothetical protein BW14_06980 [Bifidobacterium sp. UTBIF-68]|uniref:hypothetical protein n=1 Tax=Bifidobacterium sp. UTBIF-68 TaxID=1465262 RepID=UPI001129672E|nr:hypothetical protein [Bifidobacterium sp. UTBIF-68]TPF92900.1 hypothetical protein BW14_06980 [Bifidobacterium sp. UTBIF-68]